MREALLHAPSPELLTDVETVLHLAAFYANPTTGERKWQLPPGTLVLPRSADGEWYELWSDEHNLPYYFHTLTNETRWYKPTDGFVIPLKAVQVRRSARLHSPLSQELD